MTDGEGVMLGKRRGELVEDELRVSATRGEEAKKKKKRRKS